MTGNGVVALVGELETLGARVVFGMPGTQNLEFFEGLRKSSLKTVLATSELAASFMAVGYGRATGEPGILATILSEVVSSSICSHGRKCATAL